MDGTATSSSKADTIGGWKPLAGRNCDKPMSELDKELCAYSIKGRWTLKEVGCLAVIGWPPLSGCGTEVDNQKSSWRLHPKPYTVPATLVMQNMDSGSSHRDAMQPKHLGHTNVSSLKGRRHDRQWDKLNWFGETIESSKDERWQSALWCVTWGDWDWQQVQQTNRRAERVSSFTLKDPGL